LLLKSGDRLNIRFRSLPNEGLIHIKIITGTSSCTADGGAPRFYRHS
jgi:hypothetical protein